MLREQRKSTKDLQNLVEMGLTMKYERAG